MIKVFMDGRLGQEIEVRKTKSDLSVANLSLGSTSKYKDEENTSWMRCSVFGKSAEVLAQYCSKGDQLIITGEGEQRKYTDKEGVERTTFEIRVESWSFGAKSKKNETAASGNDLPPPPDLDSIPF